MTGEMCAQQPDDGVLRPAVGLRHDIYFALVADLRGVVELGEQDAPAIMGGFEGHFEVWVHHALVALRIFILRYRSSLRSSSPVIPLGRSFRGTAGVVGLTIPYLIVSFHANFDLPVDTLWRAGLRIIAEPVLRAQFLVDPLEHGIELRHRIGIIHRAAGGVGNGLEGMFAGGVAAVFAFHRANHNGVEQRLGTHGGAAGGFEIRAAGGLPGIGEQHHGAPAADAASLERLRSEEHGVVERSAVARNDMLHGGLQAGHVVGKAGELRHGIGKFKHGHAVARPDHPSNETRRRARLEFDVLSFR